jgi:Domain of unknown function (DUF5666)
MSGPDQPGTTTQPLPDQPVPQPPAVPPPLPPRSSGFDTRSLAIGAAAGLLVLLVAGIAFGAARLGALGPSDDRRGAQPPAVTQEGPVGRGGPGGQFGRGPSGDRGQTAPRGFPQFRIPGVPDALAERRQITITAIAGSNLTLATTDGWTRTITAAANTTITRAGQTITVADLKVSDQIRFQETRNADGTYTITAIEVVVPRVAGRVSATTSDSITLERVDGTTMIVHVDSNTIYRVPGVDNATLADISVGMLIVAQGTQNADGSLQALTIAAAAKR